MDTLARRVASRPWEEVLLLLLLLGASRWLNMLLLGTGSGELLGEVLAKAGRYVEEEEEVEGARCCGGGGGFGGRLLLLEGRMLEAREGVALRLRLIRRLQV